jgi:hypothetical protein
MLSVPLSKQIPRTLTVAFRMREKVSEQRTRVLIYEYELNTHEKRENFCNESDAQRTEDAETESSNSSNSPQVSITVNEGNKKEATHGDTRGTKRMAT